MRCRRLFALVFVVWVAAFVAVDTAEAGRWKWSGTTCYWDEYDSGPNQCDPNAPPPTGRYKTDGWSCWFDANDSGPNQCDPNVPVQNPYPVDTTPDTYEQSGEGFAGTDDGGGYPLQSAQGQTLESCRNFHKWGNVGVIAIQWDEFHGLAWQAWMYNPLENYSGLWWAQLYINGQLSDQKTWQWQTPHGSKPPNMQPPQGVPGAGSIITLYIVHVYFRWIVVPQYIWDYGWVFYGRFVPFYAQGTASCIVPPPGQ
jgi:hypothetical protein